jgi:hypothetical protein
MSNLDCLKITNNSPNCTLRVIAHGYEPLWAKQSYQFVENVSPCAALCGIVHSIGEGGAGLVGMQREHVPEKDRSVDLLEHVPNNVRGSLGNRSAFCRSLTIDSPTGEMIAKVHVIRERQSGSATATVPEVATDPQRIYSGA